MKPNDTTILTMLLENQKHWLKMVLKELAAAEKRKDRFAVGLYTGHKQACEADIQMIEELRK